jgi:serine/threonine protein kinase
MAVKVQCPDCDWRASVGDQLAGKVIRCKKCNGRVNVATTVHPEVKFTPNTGPGGMSEEMPKEIGGFEVRRVLGAGAFGTVYLGHDRTLDRPVALKVPHAHSFRTPQARKRFETEARAVAQLRHPHIVPIYSAGFDGEHYFIAAQFIAGPTPKGGGPVKAMSLEDAIDEQPDGLGFAKSARIVHDLAEALAYAHELGVVHRDVKPANVLLDEKGRAHLADFGLAHQESSAEKLTHDGAILGTPAYMAPEQAKGREGDVLPACDQYSLGIVLYELLTGKVPFSGPVGLVLSLHQNEEVKPPHKVRPGIPLDLETICLKALEKDPEKRYGSCGEMAADLGRWLEAVATGKRGSRRCSTTISRETSYLLSAVHGHA